MGSILEEARRLEMHERLRTESRNALVLEEGDSSGATVFKAATVNGARSLNISAGELVPGKWADVVAYDLSDPHLAGVDNTSLLDALIFSVDTRALSDVMVGGQWVVRDGVHEMTERSCLEFSEVTSKLFS